MRIAGPITRGAPLTIAVDGEALTGFSGETVAAVMLAAGVKAFRRDGKGRPRGLYCNMGTCCECMVLVQRPDGSAMNLRACLLPAVDGQVISTMGAP